MAVPNAVLDLVERFERNRDAYRDPHYNETQVRREFIDPLFHALGWDVWNEQGYAEAYKDVIHEDAIKIGGATKAPDYCFRVGGARKFFLEAKKPAVGIKSDPEPAYQLRRYAWSAKLPLSILTDFEELAVYDTRVRPARADKSSTARTLYLTFDQYPDKWDELVGLFSKDAVLKGSFDKYADSAKRKRGTAEVDDAFLKEIESWREALARNIALRNEGLSQRDLNFAVQRTIDRIVFLRICEDRAIEPYGTLQSLVNGKEIYARLFEQFRRADERYNSGLFHFSTERGRPAAPDDLTPALTIDDKVLRDMLGRLYYPDCPYEFSVLPADILGQVYEQFLGKVIRLTKGHRAVVEEKPEVRKAGGVYYTPTYIVDYIVKHTVGKLVDGKTPQQVGGLTEKFQPSRAKGVRPLAVLDPACGSGSFLLGAYQYLLDWYAGWYRDHDPESHARGRDPRLFKHPSGEWRLTTAERKRILLAHIYGVDIDSQAVETTKLSLLLKVLEGESAEMLNQTLRLLHERALPDLAANIKCGNSLIGPDFYDGQQMAMFDEEERLRINVFDWHAEFKDIMQSGGFDAVIGNPPYGAALLPSELAYVHEQLPPASKTSDSYEFFLARAANLVRSDGTVGMIIPSAWLTGSRTTETRRYLVNTLTPRAAYALPFDVFRGAYIDTAVVVFGPPTEEPCLIHYFPKKEKLSAIDGNVGTAVDVQALRDDEAARLSTLLSRETASILSKFGSCPQSIGACFDASRGVQPYSRKKHTEAQIKSRFLHATEPVTEEHLPELQGSELSRYHASAKRSSYIRYCDEIASQRPLRMFQGQRIVLRRLLTRRFRLQASMVSETLITTDNVLNIVPCDSSAPVAFVLGVLNSRLVSWFYVNNSMIAQKDDFPQVFIAALKSVPLPETASSDVDRMVDLVQTMLDLHKQLAAANTGHAKTAIQRQIDATDRQIDRLVYDLYGLTDEEIAIVEQATA